MMQTSFLRTNWAVLESQMQRRSAEVSATASLLFLVSLKLPQRVRELNTFVRMCLLKKKTTMRFHGFK